MNDTPQFDPSSIYGSADPSLMGPRAFISPGSYIQGPGVFDNLGRYLGVTGTKNPAVLITRGGRKRFGARLEASLTAAGITSHWVTFGGECSMQEIDRVVAEIGASSTPTDALMAVGAGKCCDAAKAMAYRLALPTIICPTLASTDAPCSALSVIYSPEGQVESAESYPKNPALVVIDTQIVAEAPLRYLVAGMADALATWYEARVCFDNPKASSAIGGRTTLAAAAIGELCAKTIYTHGAGAMEAVRARKANADLDHIVEANTLLSGIGFESGGLAITHAVASSFTAMPQVEEHCLHGEMVAIGLLTQLAAEGNAKEEEKVADFFIRTGLPVHLGHLGLDPASDGEMLELVAQIASTFEFAANEPFDITPELLLRGLMAIHERGLARVEASGDAAFQALR